MSPIFKLFVVYVLVERSGKKSYMGALLIVVTRAILVHEAPVTKKLVHCFKKERAQVVIGALYIFLQRHRLLNLGTNSSSFTQPFIRYIPI